MGKTKKVIYFEDLNPGYFQYRDRCERQKIPKEARKGFAEVCGSLTVENALGEAYRCFSLCPLSGWFGFEARGGPSS